MPHAASLEQPARVDGAVGNGSGADGHVPLSAHGQDEPLVYRHMDTWGDVRPSVRYQPLTFPQGHEAAGIGVHPLSGSLYVVDSTNAEIRVYDAVRRFQRIIRGQGRAALSRPVDVAPLPVGAVAVADWGVDQVIVMTEDGQFLRAFDVPSPRNIVEAANILPGIDFFVVSRAPGSTSGRIIGMGMSGITLELHTPISSPSALALARPPAGATDRDAELFVLTREPVASSGGGGTDPSAGPGVALWSVRLGRSSGGFLDVMRRGALSEDTRAIGVVPGDPEAPFPAILSGTTCSGVRRGRIVEHYRVSEDLPNLDWGAISVRDLAVMGDGALVVSHSGGVWHAGHTEELWAPSSYPGSLRGARRLAAGADAWILGEWPHLLRWSTDGEPNAVVPPHNVGRAGVLSRSQDIAAAGPNVWWMETAPGNPAQELIRRRGEQVVGTWEFPRDMDVSAIAAHGQDGIAILDRTAREVHVFPAGPDGAGHVWSYGEQVGIGFMQDMAMSSDRIFLADPAQSEVLVFHHDGRLDQRIWTGFAPYRLDVGSDGTVFVLVASNWVYAYDEQGRGVGAWPVTLPGPSAQRMADLTVTDDGRLLVLDESGVVDVFQPGNPASGPTEPGRVPPASFPPTESTRCDIRVDKVAQHEKVNRRDFVRIDLHVVGACPEARSEEPPVVDLVFAIDASGSMTGEKLALAKDAVRGLLASIEMDEVRVGLVSFNQTATVHTGLTRDLDALHKALGGITAIGGTWITAGYGAALETLLDAVPRSGATPLILFLSDGQSPLTGLQWYRDRARRAGVETVAVGFGQPPARDVLMMLASHPGYYFEERVDSDLVDIFEWIGRHLVTHEAIRKGTITDWLPANMEYVPNTGIPVEPSVSPDGRRLTWDLANVLEPGTARSYAVRPQQVGLWPTNDVADLTYEDGMGVFGRLEFPVPHVEVRPDRLFLPLALKERCPPTQFHVAMVIDASTSMHESLQPGAAPKIAEALTAARQWVEGANLSHETFSIITFNDRARVLASGESDRTALHAALNRVVTHPGTRIDLGLRAAREQISALREERAGAGDIVLLLSDGRPMPGTRRATVEEAERLRAMDVELFAVAVGDGADRDLLGRMVGQPTRLFDVRRAGALQLAFRQVAGRLQPCRERWPADGCDPERWP